MVQLLGEWKGEIEAAGKLSPRHFRVIARFFGDLDIESSTGVAARITNIDLNIYDCTHHDTSPESKSAATPTGMSEQDRLWIRKRK